MTHIAQTQTALAAFLPCVVAQARLADIHDSLTLALDATENRHGYTQTEREARSYIRSAIRQTQRLMGDEA
ncbi:hypothetical protein JJJ17_07170 [Paracoccus caeni]|uniref:Uncharacterized protein n=1 Tax=Paracoccus caeni TaxID=657651 RepID=A0A934VZC9_9RHOB|nr:hypothetical protein [Paracoccus caeni]MBK4215700.1 hypothetical protein [Paracoccus caeni]